MNLKLVQTSKAEYHKISLLRHPGKGRTIRIDRNQIRVDQGMKGKRPPTCTGGFLFCAVLEWSIAPQNYIACKSELSCTLPKPKAQPGCEGCRRDVD
jgi:hypothetical protein